MSFRKKQRGLSFIGLIVLVGVLGFLGVIGLKLIPIYIESWKIDGIMNAVIKEPGINDQSRQEVIEAMLKRLDIDAVDSVNYTNWKDRLAVTKRKNNITIKVTYEITTPRIWNLSLGANGDKAGAS